MRQRRKFRPNVDGLEERLALNGTMAAAGVMAPVNTGSAAVTDVKHKGGGMVHHPHKPPVHHPIVRHHPTVHHK
jgi:hypothetical protein